MFCVQQFVDVSRKGMPRKNDPSTVCETLDRLEFVFSRISTRYIGPTIVRLEQVGNRNEGSENDCICAVFPMPSFSELLDSVINPMRYHGCSDVVISRRIIYFLGSIGSRVSSHGSLFSSRKVCIENHIESIVTECCRKFAPGSDEVHSILLAAKHARFLIHTEQSSGIRVCPETNA
jgi:uncharacterized membrane protein